MEYLEHRSGDASGRLLKKSGKIGPLLGAGLGCLPQCGFSAAASGLYGGRLITAGTLIAVFLSTSDEMLPVMISNGVSILFLISVLGIKVAIGVLVGFLVDLIGRGHRSDAPQIEEFCEREHCDCHDHFALSALKHTVHVGVFLFLVTLILNGAVELIGEETLKGAVLNRPVLSNLMAAVVGVIPNCASSVVLTELQLSGIISVGSMLSGLLVNGGVGLLVLFRNNRPLSDSLRILAILFAAGVLSGLLVDLTPLGGWIASLR
ncbi:MAG: hypothetical protein E7620_07860 [Ruminococcaceae bacterium]|nr:hypothetical protein [Oscillospiraceae bacterium]